MQSSAQAAGKEGGYTVVTYAQEYGMCIQKRGRAVPVSKGRWHRPCCAEQRRAPTLAEPAEQRGRVGPGPKEADKEAEAHAPDQGVLRYE